MPKADTPQKHFNVASILRDILHDVFVPIGHVGSAPWAVLQAVALQTGLCYLPYGVAGGVAPVRVPTLGALTIVQLKMG